MMGWTDLFKSKSTKLKPDPRIRWFGKLPSYADYYSSPAEEDWAVEFNDWVLKGYQVYQSRLVSTGTPRGRLPISGCVLRLPASGMTVLASIQDYGGDMSGRPFPLCFYVGIPTAAWPGPTGDLSFGATRVLDELAVLRREVPRFLNSPGRFESVFGGREVDLDVLDGGAPDGSWTRQARAVSLADWFAGAQPGLKVSEAEAWFPLVARWGDKLAALESKTFEPTFRLPLAAGVSGEVQTAGWLRWLESRMDLTRRRLSLVVSAELDGRVGHLGVVARELVPEDFLLATSLSHTLPYLDDVSQLEASGSGRSASQASGTGARSGGTWLDFAEGPVAAS